MKSKPSVILVSLARRGGMLHYLVELGEALAPLVSTSAVLAASATEIRRSRMLAMIRVRTGRNSFESFLYSWNPVAWLHLLAQMRMVRADVVHIVGAHQWNPAVALICKVLRLPVVYTVHDPDHHPGAPLSIRISDWMTSLLADHIVVMTRYGSARLGSRGFLPSRISVIPHPMYTLFRKWQPRPSRQKSVILYFGRIEPYKGLEVLFQAFQAIGEILKPWRLIVAGIGNLPDSHTKWKGKRIEFRNRYIPEPEVARLMDAASIVVLPYTSSSQSGVVALAQAFQRPVVATSVGGIPEGVIQGETGILVPPGDAAKLARAIRTLVLDPGLRTQMQRNIAILGRLRWDPEVIARAHVRLYTEILRQWRRV